jgi:hypothetical protein
MRFEFDRGLVHHKSISSRRTIMDVDRVLELAKITKLHPLVLKHRYGHSVTFDDVLLALKNHEFLNWYCWSKESGDLHWYKENDQAFTRLVNLLEKLVDSFDKAIVFHKFAVELRETWSRCNVCIERTPFSELYALVRKSLHRTAESREEIIRVWELYEWAKNGLVGTSAENANSQSSLLLDKLSRIVFAEKSDQ